MGHLRSQQYKVLLQIVEQIGAWAWGTNLVTSILLVKNNLIQSFQAFRKSVDLKVLHLTALVRERFEIVQRCELCLHHGHDLRFQSAPFEPIVPVFIENCLLRFKQLFARRIFQWKQVGDISLSLLIVFRFRFHPEINYLARWTIQRI